MGMGNDLVREARRRAQMTQRELAERAGTTQSAIARLESGKTAPSFDQVIRLVRLCGMDLLVNLQEYDGSDWAQAQRLLAVDAADRLEHHTHLVRQFEAIRRHRPAVTAAGPPSEVRVLHAVADAGVEFVLIGGFAAMLHGSCFATEGVDIVPSGDVTNVDRLDHVLAGLNASEIVTPPPRRALLPAPSRNLRTDLGEINVVPSPAGTDGFADLVRDAASTEIDGVEVRVASLADIIRSKQAANRDKDLRVLPVLRRILAEGGDVQQ